MKGFNFDFLMMDRVTSFEEDLNFDENLNGSNLKNKSPTSTISKFSRIAQNLTNKRKGAKWRQLIEATRNKVIPFSRSQDSIDSDAIAGTSDGNETNSNQTVDRNTSKLDANVRRQIFAMKMDSVSLSQPVLQTGTITESSAQTAAAACLQQRKPMITTKSPISTKENTKQVETKVVENKKSTPCDIITQKDEWI